MGLGFARRSRARWPLFYIRLRGPTARPSRWWSSGTLDFALTFPPLVSDTTFLRVVRLAGNDPVPKRLSVGLPTRAPILQFFPAAYAREGPLAEGPSRCPALESGRPRLGPLFSPRLSTRSSREGCEAADAKSGVVVVPLFCCPPRSPLTTTSPRWGSGCSDRGQIVFMKEIGCRASLLQSQDSEENVRARPPDRRVSTPLLGRYVRDATMRLRERPRPRTLGNRLSDAPAAHHLNHSPHAFLGGVLRG